MSPHPHRGSPAPSRKPQLRTPPSILVVDDDPAMRALLSDVLQREEAYQVVQAGDGLEALGALRTRRFAVLVLDQNLPGASGLTLLPRIRRLAPQTHVILITAFGDVASCLEALEQGAVAFLFKPFRMAELTLAISRALQPGSTLPRFWPPSHGRARATGGPP